MAMVTPSIFDDGGGSSGSPPIEYIDASDGSSGGSSSGDGSSGGGGSSEPVDPNNAMYRLVLEYYNYQPTYVSMSDTIPQTVDTVYAPIQDGVVNTAILADCPTSITAVYDGSTPCYLIYYRVVDKGYTITDYDHVYTRYAGETFSVTWHGGRNGTTYRNCYAAWATNGIIIYHPGTLSSYQRYRSRYKTAGTPLTLPNGWFTRDGYIQNGWTKTDGGAKQYDFGDSYTPSNGAVEFMYPSWEEYTPPGTNFTITIHPNDATGEDIILTVEAGAEVVIPDASTYSRNGYHLSVWNESPDGDGSSWIPGETYIFERGADVELYAIWAGDEYTVHYASGVPGDTNYIHESKAVYGEPFYTDRVPYPDGKEYCTFDGWIADDNTVLTKADAWFEAYSYGSDPTWTLQRDLVIYPRWTPYWSSGKVFFGGMYSDDCSIRVEEPPSYIWPEYSYAHDKVYGKSGDILRDNGRYENVSKKYKISAYDGTNFFNVSRKVSEWLHRKGSKMYMRLEDSYEPDVYMMAVYEETNELDNLLATAGKCEITFNCMPQKFLLSGDVPIDITQSGQVITNPTSNPAFPIITFSGTGNIYVNGKAIAVADNFNIINFHTDSFNAFDIVGRNMNGYIYVLDSLILNPGDNVIEYDGYISDLKITPRWWRV